MGVRIVDANGEDVPEAKPLTPKESFTSDLEIGLGRSIEDLTKEDQSKGIILEQLKKELMDEIKFGGDDAQTENPESYLDDLRLSMDDLKSIYEMPHLKILFEEAGVVSFEAFVEFLMGPGRVADPIKGISHLSEDQTVIAGEVVTLFAFSVHGDIKEAAGVKLKTMLEALNQNPLFKDKIKRNSISTTGANRINFFVMEDGQKVDYIAVDSSVYKVLESNEKEVGPYGNIARLVVDIETGEKFREKSDPVERSFSFESVDENNNVVSREVYSKEDGGHVTEKRIGETEKWQIQERDFGGALIARRVRNDKTNLTTTYREDGTISEERDANSETTFDEKGKPVLRIYRHSESKDVLRAFIYDDKGEPIGLINEEKDVRGGMTEGEYLDYLAKQLDTPEKLDAFMKFYMRYTSDRGTYNSELSVFDNLQSLIVDEYWQQPDQTFGRVENGKMLGDCDDYAFLAKAILERQSKLDGKERNPHVIYVPGHAECVWSEKRPDGKYDFYSMGTFGLDKNGAWNGSLAVCDGFYTVADGLNELMQKYKTGGLGLKAKEVENVKDSITLLEVPHKGEREFVRNVPLEVFVDGQAYKAWQKLKPYIEDGDFEGFNRVVGTLPPRGYYYEWAAKAAEEKGEQVVAARYREVTAKNKREEGEGV